MNTTSLVIQLDAWAREELAGQKALSATLAEQERAVSANDAAALAEAAQKVEALLKRGPARERRRRELLGRLGEAFGVQPETLTLTSILERAASEGVAVEGLRSVRDELRKESALVLRTGRRIAALARYHQAFLAEVLRILAPAEDESSQPVLFDARG